MKLTAEEEIKQLKEKVTKLEINKTKLLDSLRLKKNKDELFNVNLTESDLLNFEHYDRCDKKLLAILYWEKLSDKQKSLFTDSEQMKLRKANEARLEKIMTNPTKMRQHFLKGAAPVMDTMIKLANGDEKLTVDNYAIKEVWEVLKGIITTANSPAPMLDLRGKDISTQIDKILTEVTKGDITFVEAKEYMSLISSGFNLLELPKLMAKLDLLESK